MTGPVAATRLTGAHVLLEPLTVSHVDGAARAVAADDLWRSGWYTGVPAPDAMAAEVEARLARQRAGTMVPFAQLDPDTGEVLGMTSYCNVDRTLPRVEVGHTWLARRVQGTMVNPEAKLMLLQHAFETLGCVGVELRTSWHNRQSRAAIERLGAKRDGVLRNATRHPDGTLRDTVVYSVLPHEWPAVRSGLLARLGR